MCTLFELMVLKMFMALWMGRLRILPDNTLRDMRSCTFDEVMEMLSYIMLPKLSISVLTKKFLSQESSHRLQF